MALLQASENQSAEKFAAAHYRKHKKTIEVVLTVTATGLGYSVKIQCPHCRKTEDITDTSTW